MPYASTASDMVFLGDAIDLEKSDRLAAGTL
jgi:hypothetical protein